MANPNRQEEASSQATNGPYRGAASIAERVLMKTIVDAHFVEPSQLFLKFADGQTGTWSFDELQLDMMDMKPETIKTSSCGTSIEMQTIQGENVQLDASSLRYAIDPNYAAEIDQSIRNSHISPKEFDKAAAFPLDPRWYDIGDEDDLL
jgi:hypothetical protein